MKYADYKYRVHGSKQAAINASAIQSAGEFHGKIHTILMDTVYNTEESDIEEFNTRIEIAWGEYLQNKDKVYLVKLI